MAKIKKAVSLLLCLAVILCIPMNAFATGASDPDEYIEFVPGEARMSSDGSFTFNIRQYVTSGAFIANSSSIQINTRAYISRGGSTYTDSSVSFILTLYNSSGSEVGSYRGYADGVYGGRSFSVTSGQRYYFRITVNTSSLGSSEYLNGSGRVSPVTVV